MLGTKKGIFLEVGRSLASSKPHVRKPTYSYTSTKPSFLPQAAPSSAPPINHGEKSLASRRRSIQTTSKVNRTAGVLAGGINDDIMQNRKENHLNTCFNVRQNKIREINKENKKLHDRINSQKSLYSSSDLNKSFESNCEIKKRLSSSKLSQRSSTSRSSLRKNANSIALKKHPQLEIKTANIEKADARQLRGFKGLFMNDPTTRNKLEEKESITHNSYRKNDVYMRSATNSVKRSIETIRETAREPCEGGLLHRIAEEMLPGKERKEKQSHGYLRGIKKTKNMFNF